MQISTTNIALRILTKNDNKYEDKVVSKLHINTTIHFGQISVRIEIGFCVFLVPLLVKTVCCNCVFLEKLMASISQTNQFPCKTLSQNPPHNQFTSKPSILPLNSVRISRSLAKKSFLSIQGFTRARPLVLTRAADDDEWGPEKEKEEGGALAVAEEESPKEVTEIDNLKKTLVDSFYGTDRGLNATSETRAEIVELITQLEAKNPTPAPTEALTLLNAKWILV